jgi:uncharacterized protein (TIGR02246 family)
MTDSNPTDSVVSVIRAVYDAWADGDAAAFAKLYTDDATVVQPGVRKKTNDEIRTTMAAGFAGPLKGSRVVDEPQSIRFLGLDTAVVITEGGVLMAGQTELPGERLVRATWVLAKRNEGGTSLPTKTARRTDPTIDERAALPRQALSGSDAHFSNVWGAQTQFPSQTHRFQEDEPSSRTSQVRTKQQTAVGVTQNRVIGTHTP